ncbi:MAG: hypothetical protein CMI18_13415 [Opitutaceae bacterium]|nr:hypothetical protein [Opitutaceae bacterium]|tara:strand:+ start:6097 stop:6558 length:462 start_codon:yes stop_codon:yes gene_type:complete
MKYPVFVIFVYGALTSQLIGLAKLTYHHEGQTYSVDGFYLDHPYLEIAGGKKYLPLDGKWGLKIEDESFRGNAYYPITSKIIKSSKKFTDLNTAYKNFTGNCIRKVYDPGVEGFAFSSQLDDPEAFRNLSYARRLTIRQSIGQLLVDSITHIS